MRVVLDTNVVVSALLFGGPPRELLRLLCSPAFEVWTSRPDKEP
jgi:predicted nucleic acid-binding protein